MSNDISVDRGKNWSCWERISDHRAASVYRDEDGAWTMRPLGPGQKSTHKSQAEAEDAAKRFIREEP